MAYSGHKKEDIEDTSMERHWKSARPAKAWNPFGQLPAPQRGGGGEEESCDLPSLNLKNTYETVEWCVPHAVALRNAVLVGVNDHGNGGSVAVNLKL